MSIKNSVHIKMTREERAKQFMPFAALKGYEEALRRKEAEVEAKAEPDKEPVTEPILKSMVESLIDDK